MNMTFTDKTKQAAEQFILLEQTEKQLEEVLGESSELVEARWDRTEDARGRSVYVLSLKDSFGEVSGNFAPTELQSPNQIDFRLYRLWGDLLGAQTKKLLQEIAGH